MANTYNWRFYQETGLEGGTGNPTQNVYYIDPQNGDDANTGAYNAPFKTIQKKIDTDSTADIVVCGSFTGTGIAGDFTGFLFGGVIAEGLVEFENSAGSGFNTGATVAALNASFYSTASISVPREFGTLHFKNYGGAIQFSQGASGGEHGFAGNCIFENCLQMCVLSNHSFPTVKRCLFINSTMGTGILRMGQDVNQLDNNTFINSSVAGTHWIGANFAVRNNYFDATSTYTGTTGVGTPTVFNWNFFEGTLTNKIRVESLYYDNIEDFKVAHPTLAVNDLPSTTNPLLNSHNSKDFTPSQTSPLVKAGFDKSTIGFAEPAEVIDTSDATYFTHGPTFDVSPGEVTINSGGAHSFETNTNYHHEIAPKKRVVLKINAPDLEQNFGLGETMGNLAADNTPYKTDVEIQYSGSYSLANGVDGTASYNGTWLRVPVGEQPYHDTFYDVGNDDPLFDIDNAIPISTRYLKFKITLRDNETQI